MASRAIHITIDRPDPSKEIISKYKNFDLFIANYGKYQTPSGFRKLIRNDIGRLVLFIILAILLLLWYLGEI